MSTQLFRFVICGVAVVSPIAFAQPQLQEVIVTASRMETPIRQVGAAVSVLDSEEIALRGYNSMAELLRTQPGVAISNSGGPGKATTLRIRGEEGYRTLVLIDGVEISDPTATQVGPHVEHLPLGADIQQIEILRGPQGFLYGADAGGVVNIITRTAAGFASELSMEAGRYDTVNVHGFVAAGDKQSHGFVSVNQHASAGFNARVDDASGEADGYDNTTLHGKFGLGLGQSWRAQLVARSTDAVSEYDNCGGSNDCINEFTQNIGKLSLIREQARSSHSIAVSRAATQRSSLAEQVSDFSTEGSISAVEYIGSAKLTPQLTMVAGGDAEQHSIISSTGKRGDRDQFGLFSEAQMNIENAFYLSAGLRFDDNQDFGNHVSARIAPALIQSLGDNNIKYRASWGTGFRAPSQAEIFFNRGPAAKAPAANVILAEETSEGYDVGVEFYSSAGHSLQLGYFDQQIENEIFFDLVNYSGYLQVDGVSHSRGGEVALELPLGQALLLSANYTYNETLTDADITRARRPRHLANIALSFSGFDERLRMLLSARAAHDAVEDVYQQGRVPLDDYQVLNLSVHVKPVAELTLSARVENALDEQYRELRAYHTAGRALYAGARYSF